MNRDSQPGAIVTEPIGEHLTKSGAEAARIFRGDTIEAEHYASIVVMDGEGNMTHYLGEPDLTVMARSSIKPFQVLPFVESPAFDQYGFSQQQLAIMCGSHNGTDTHRDLVLSILEKIGLSAEDLQCGGDWPLGMQDKRIFPHNDEEKDPVRHNCSGKHAGFLAHAKTLGIPIAEYLNPNSTLQQLVRQSVGEFCEYDIESWPIGIDGCSAPNFPIPLQKLALGFMKLANDCGRNANQRNAVKRIRTAVQEFPEMASGEGRFDLAIMQSFPNRVVCKIGAEALEGIGFADPPLGIAVKIHDGANRALGPICVEVLLQLGIFADFVDFPLLQPYQRPEMKNARRSVTGHIEAKFSLVRV